MWIRGLTVGGRAQALRANLETQRPGFGLRCKIRDSWVYASGFRASTFWFESRRLKVWVNTVICCTRYYAAGFPSLAFCCPPKTY